MIVGIVGKPSGGKSTFFKAATLADVEIANYPFTTIKPNNAVGFVKVKDPAREFDKTSNPRVGYVQEEFRFLPINLIDVAGLVPGAHEGEGMGAQFLNDLNQADVLVHLVDVSGSVNEKGEACEPGSYDPANDIFFLEEELDYWYKAILAKSWEKFARVTQQEKQEIHKAIAKQMSGVSVTEELAQEKIKQLNLPEKVGEWNEDQLLQLARELRIATKPMLIAANKIDVPGARDNFVKLKEQFPQYTIIPCSAESELALKEAAKHELINYIPGSTEMRITNPEKLNEKQTAALEFINTTVLKEGGTGIQEVLNTAVFDLLKFKPIYPGGVSKLEDSEGRVLPDCFIMPPDTTALDFAFKLHTDFGKNFIKAINVKTKMPVGKDHVLEPGDIIEIAANK
ncbi:MAG: redox-regulated ATPase YchF [Candidatus Woesearchaeota archaeon]|nr:redox-regulated ATPase YchF [Candidatus Woesearchaeota archaeon]